MHHVTRSRASHIRLNCWRQLPSLFEVARGPYSQEMADSYEDLEPYFPEDDFAEKYADELEMLREWDDSQVPPLKRRQLFPPEPPPPQWERVARSDPKLQDLPVKDAQPVESSNEGEISSHLFNVLGGNQGCALGRWVSLELQNVLTASIISKCVSSTVFLCQVLVRRWDNLDAHRNVLPQVGWATVHGPCTSVKTPWR